MFPDRYLCSKIFPSYTRIKHICPHKHRVTSCVEFNIYRKQYTSWGRSSGIQKMFSDRYLCSKIFPSYTRIKHICPHKHRVTSCVEFNIYRKQYTSWGRSSGIQKMFSDRYLCSKILPKYIFDSSASKPTIPNLFATATRPAFPRTLNTIYSFVVRKDIQERSRMQRNVIPSRSSQKIVVRKNIQEWKW